MIAVIAAMKKEAEAIASALSDNKKSVYRGIEIWEGETQGKKLAVVLSGVGKVNAAYTAAIMLERYKPSALISTGLAGGLGKLSPLNVFVADKAVQHDMDTTALGDPIGFISGINKIEISADPALSDALSAAVGGAARGIIATGDTFIADSLKAAEIVRIFGATACDMESAAIAQAAYLYGIPFAILRTISDGGTAGAELTFEQLAEKACGINAAAVLKAVGKI